MKKIMTITLIFICVSCDYISLPTIAEEIQEAYILEQQIEKH